MTRADILELARSAERSAAYWEALHMFTLATQYRLEAAELRAEAEVMS
jgi:hypothetical protein